MAAKAVWVAGRKGRREVDPEEASVAVMAHALLGSMAVISGAAETLSTGWPTLTDANRRALLAVVNGQSEHVMGLLRDLIKGLPQEPIRALELMSGGGDLGDPDDAPTSPQDGDGKSASSVVAALGPRRPPPA